MHIVEETKIGYDVECGCHARFYVSKSAGVASCPHCGTVHDPRHLKYKWARGNDPFSTNLCQAL
jgi:hypothetical protein